MGVPEKARKPVGSGPEAEAIGERARSVRSQGRVLKRPLQLPCQKWTGGTREDLGGWGGPCVSQMEWRVLRTRGEVSVKVGNPGDGRMPAALGGRSTR